MLRKSLPHRQISSSYSSVAIAAMPLDQLRELSDLQLSERELADVIEAIHNGGGGFDEDAGETSGQSDLEADRCLLCKQDEQLTSPPCLACQGCGTQEDVKSQTRVFAQWAEWYRQYKLWASSQQQNQPVKQHMPAFSSNI